jgi:hypothetical protein
LKDLALLKIRRGSGSGSPGMREEDILFSGTVLSAPKLGDFFVALNRILWQILIS